MSLKGCIQLAYINIKGEKKYNIKRNLIIFISFTLFILIISIYQSVDKFVNSYLLKMLDHRNIMVSYNVADEENVINILNSSDMIVEFKEYTTPIAGKIEKFEGHLNLVNGFEKEMPHLVEGELFTESDKNVGIIPEKFDPTGEVSVSFGKESLDYKNGKDYIGKDITLVFNIDKNNPSLDFKYTFTVIGVYNAIESLNYPSDIYIPYNDLVDLNKRYSEAVIDESDDSEKTIITLVDDIDNVNSVINYLNSNNIYAYKRAEIGFFGEVLEYILYIGSICILLALIISTINVNLININTLKNKKNNLYILKSMGYSNHHIGKIILTEYIIVNFSALILSIITSKIVLLILNIIIKNYFSIYMQNLNFNLCIISLNITIILMCFSIINTSIKSIKYTNKVSINEGLKGIDN